MRYRLQRHDGTDCSATMVPITVLRMVPIQRYRQYPAVDSKCVSSLLTVHRSSKYRSFWLHIPEHTRSLSGSLLGYKTIP